MLHHPPSSVYPTQLKTSPAVPALRERVLATRNRLDALTMTDAAAAGQLAAARYSDFYDALLRERFAACQQSAAAPRLALGAVGSYGRRVLSPRSDLDVRLLCNVQPSAAAELAEQLLYPLWDAGLDVGHQVVTADSLIELAQTDLATATAILDFRTLAGDPNVADEMVQRAFTQLFSGPQLQAFVERLAAYNSKRHARYGDSVYLLEPNIKNGAGGLRDLDVAHWHARAAHGVRDLGELVALGVISAREWQGLHAARQHLLRVRHALHVSVGRKTDRLTFDQQEIVARALGYGANALAVERLMSDYYRHARVIRLASEVLTPPPRRGGRVQAQPLDSRFAHFDDGLGLANESDLEADPALAILLYAEAIEQNQTVSAPTRRLIARHTAEEKFSNALRSCASLGPLVRQLVCTVRETELPGDSILTELHEVGLLLAIFPEFAPVVGRVHHDTYHVYTVDVHSIAAVDHLRKLARGDDTTDHPLACRLAAEQVQREVLFFATFLHDVGKVLGGAGHSERGALMAEPMLKRLGFEPNRIADVQRLIRLHLRLYLMATRRDVEDPATISQICDEVGNQEALRDLYLLTVADVTTTSPTSMTQWKRDMLDELYRQADRALALTSAQTPPAPSLRLQVLTECEDPALSQFLGQFLNGLPERYLLANDVASVLAHAKFALQSQGKPSAVTLGSRRGLYAELWVVADDRPGLLALIAASFRRAGLNVLSAQVYSWSSSDGVARSLDIFWVRHRSQRGLEDADLQTLQASLEHTLAEGVDGNTVSMPPPSGRAGGSLPPIKSQVNIDNRSAPEHSIIEVITQDRPNLLFWLSHKLQQLGLSIWFAKLNTEGERVADVFYVSDGNQGRVLDPDRLEEIRTQLLAVAARVDS